MNLTATYSPEDNKLRLYSVSKLPRDLYERVRAAGFIWAAKQELFVAPAWTPAREDLLLELCGEIDDEDKSLVERAEERADRFEDYSDKRAGEAHQAKASVDAIADQIPFGQPILVGHHSERHARKHAEQIENGMRKAVRLWETSRYWVDRAKGAISHAKYKELPAVRARRIKKIEADLRKAKKELERLSLMLKLWDNKGNELPLKAALLIANSANDGGLRLPDGTDYWSTWSPLDNGTVTPAYVQEQKRKSLPPAIAHQERWIRHYENRLAYERAMLGEAGGIASDRTKPEKGGACKCWCSPGYGKGWSFIKKVNKVSVTVEDNFGTGGKNFTRTIPFDKLTTLMTKAEVDQARAEGRLYETAFKDGFFLGTPAESRQESRERVHQESVAAAKDNGKEFEAMKETLKAGVKVVSAPQLFPTPPEIARQVVALAEIQAKQRILEPSAGTGNLLRAMYELPFKTLPDARDVVIVEIADGVCINLKNEFPCAVVYKKDFLAMGDELGLFDRVLMNPPFSKGEDIKHIQHALNFLKDGGRLVAICANGPRQQETLQPLATAWIDLPPGSFKEEGTNVNTAIVVIDK